MLENVSLIGSIGPMRYQDLIVKENGVSYAFVLKYELIELCQGKWYHWQELN